ncbi:MAG: hypothetical protein HN348_24720 [Proteobacteria bacterium]|nr:hypothetical protein [Pseudomonadota bacterium]
MIAVGWMLLGLTGQVGAAEPFDGASWGMSADDVLGVLGDDCKSKQEKDRVISGAMLTRCRRDMSGMKGKAVLRFINDKLTSMTVELNGSRAKVDQLFESIGAEYGSPDVQSRDESDPPSWEARSVWLSEGVELNISGVGSLAEATVVYAKHLLPLKPNRAYSSISKMPQKPASCPEEGSKQVLAQVMNSGFVADYFLCPITVPVSLMSMDNAFSAIWTMDGLVPFWVASPGTVATPSNPLLGSRHTLAVVPKSISSSLFAAAPGSAMTLHGFPVYVIMNGSPMDQVFYATALELE